MVLIRDPSGLAEHALTLSMPALRILSLMDGEHTVEDIQREFYRQTGQFLPGETLDRLLSTLDKTHFLDGPAFESYYGGLVEDYRRAPTRRMGDARGMGFEDGDVVGGLDALFPFERDGQAGGQLAAIVAPHLDYQRGQPCYLAAYSTLSSHTHFRRFVILGTNHFGRSTAAVATAKSFETPLGISAVDTAFLEKLEQRCRHSLRDRELDHQREHSVELQVLLLQHLFGADSFEIVPILCPNPCGPAGTAPEDGVGVDLKDLAIALREQLDEDPVPTCLIAGADLSHVGGFFGDEQPMTEQFLEQVQHRDHSVLQRVAANDADGFRESVSTDDNPTRICSAGCIYTLMTALPEAKARLLKYHQAVNDEAQCTVTCAATVFETP